MKIIQSQKGYSVQITSQEWLKIGQEAGWLQRTAQYGSCYGCQGVLGSDYMGYGGRSYCQQCYQNLSAGPDNAFPDVL